MDISKALKFAELKHQHQVRKYTNEPYVNHCVNVANILNELEYHPTIITAALLHDTVEDTQTTIEEIESEFGILVARLVEQLTDVYTSRAFPNIKRKERKLLECYRLSKITADAKTIKLADLIDNTSSIVERDPAFAKIYLKEKEELLTVLGEGNSYLMRRAVDLLKESKIKLGI